MGAGRDAGQCATAIRGALGRLAPIVESELRRLARLYLSREEAGHTLQPTALVNEAYLRLIEWKTVGWQNRAPFYAVAAKMMRCILVNQALSRTRQKRGGSAVLVSLAAADKAEKRSADIVALDEALMMLAKIDDRKSQLVELRFFAGLTAEETARCWGFPCVQCTGNWTLREPGFSVSCAARSHGPVEAER